MRIILSAGVAASFVIAAAAQPLEPGQSAGVRKARISPTSETLMLSTGAAIMAGVGIAVSGGALSGSSTGAAIPSQPLVAPTIVTTTTTTTTG